MKETIMHAIDWTSLKMNAVCLLGFISGSTFLAFMAGLATGTTIIYNGIRIFKELKTKK